MVNGCCGEQEAPFFFLPGNPRSITCFTTPEIFLHLSIYLPLKAMLPRETRFFCFLTPCPADPNTRRRLPVANSDFRSPEDRTREIISEHFDLMKPSVIPPSRV